VFQHTRCFLLVDAATHESEQVSAEVPVERESGVVRTFTFDFQRQRVRATAVLHARGPAPDLGQPICFVSESVQRVKHYQVRLHRDGTRKIMYYDESAAFDQPRDGPTAILLLEGHDTDLDAYRASMGDGLLPISYLEQVRAYITGESDPPP